MAAGPSSLNHVGWTTPSHTLGVLWIPRFQLLRRFRRLRRFEKTGVLQLVIAISDGVIFARLASMAMFQVA
jgi:hypothetical protein